MAQIAYLFGAGASCEWLPVNEQIPDHIDAFRNDISGLEFTDQQQSLTRAKNLLMHELQVLHGQGKRHASIDTYAKKLFITENYKQLKKLKLAFSVFLVGKQMGKPADRRYDAFFASVIEGPGSSLLPSNLKIFTWNYDYQLELAYREFSMKKNLSDCGLKVLNKFCENWDGCNIDESFVLKLNGDTSLQFPDIHYFEWETGKPPNATSLTPILESYVAQMDSPDDRSNLYFAWNKDEKLLNFASRLDVRTLVVIGYSFPIFNRKVDRDLLMSMWNLEKVYIQSNELKYAESCLQRFRTMFTRPVEVELIVDTKQFYIPNVLDR